MSKNTGIAELVGRLGRMAHALQFTVGLNPAQWEALRFLAHANRYSRTPTALAEYLGTTKGTVSQTLIALESKGYIRRARSKSDRRVIELELTDAGSGLLQTDPVLKIERMVDDMGAELGAPLVRGLSLLLHDMQVEVGAREFGVCEPCAQFRHRVFA